jgi:hypothetical protein
MNFPSARKATRESKIRSKTWSASFDWAVQTSGVQNHSRFATRMPRIAIPRRASMILIRSSTPVGENAAVRLLLPNQGYLIASGPRVYPVRRGLC